MEYMGKIFQDSASRKRNLVCWRYGDAADVKGTNSFEMSMAMLDGTAVFGVGSLCHMFDQGGRMLNTSMLVRKHSSVPASSEGV